LDIYTLLLAWPLLVWPPLVRPPRRGPVGLFRLPSVARACPSRSRRMVGGPRRALRCQPAVPLSSGWAGAYGV